MNAGETLLAVRDLDVHIGESHILHGVSFDVRAGGITGLLGRNGVGKTTTLRGILGLVPRRGSVRLGDTELVGLSVHAVVRQGVGYVPEDRDVFAGLTVTENLRLAERQGSVLRYDLVYELFPELKVRGAQRAGTLSGGQQQMVALARALLNADNRILLIDEPTKGLAPLQFHRRRRCADERSGTRAQASRSGRGRSGSLVYCLANSLTKSRSSFPPVHRRSPVTTRQRCSLIAPRSDEKSFAIFRKELTRQHT